MAAGAIVPHQRSAVGRLVRVRVGGIFGIERAVRLCWRVLVGRAFREPNAEPNAEPDADSQPGSQRSAQWIGRPRELRRTLADRSHR